MNTTLVALVARLKVLARVQASEKFDDPADFNMVFEQAVSLHNSSYTCTETACTVPRKEAFPVELLAWSLLCHMRASRFAQDANISTDQFKTSRDSPFDKNMRLAEGIQNRYKQTCQALGLSVFYGAGGPVRQSETTAVAHEFGYVTPLDIALIPPHVQLSGTYSVGSDLNGQVILRLETIKFSQFGDRLIYSLTHATETLFTEWQGANKTHEVGKINLLASLLLHTQDQKQVAFKVTGLSPAVGDKHRFLVVTRNLSGIPAYSNELVITVPDP
jgi:hypothetical protein